MTHWDWLLIAGVATMGITVAYLRRPQHKANVMFLPVPFTLATLSVGKPVDATNVLAMPVLFGFAIAVWALHARWLLALIALHTATGEAEYLTKAIAAANSIVRGQQPSGDYKFCSGWHQLRCCRRPPASATAFASRP